MHPRRLRGWRNSQRSSARKTAELENQPPDSLRTRPHYAVEKTPVYDIVTAQRMTNENQRPINPLCLQSGAEIIYCKLSGFRRWGMFAPAEPGPVVRHYAGDLGNLRCNECPFERSSTASRFQDDGRAAFAFNAKVQVSSSNIDQLPRRRQFRCDASAL